MRHPRYPIRFALAFSLIAPCVGAQASFATQVVAFDTNGNAGGGVFHPANALGRPEGGVSGGGSVLVHSLGVDGYLTLGFGVHLVDGPGADLIVSENPFVVAVGQVYAELMFVEVSSNGVDFARFPSRYFGGDGSSFAINTPGFVSGLAGQTPVFASAPGVDAQDVVEAGGDAFDLADLRTHPLVISGAVNLHAIAQVRLVDVVSTHSQDSRGRVILDPSSGSADVDGVTLIHDANNVSPNGPEVDLHIPADGNLTLTISDPDGIGDLDPASLRMSLYGQTIDPASLIAVMTLQNVHAHGFTLVLGGPLPPGLPVHMAVSIKDRAGHRSGAMRVRLLD